MNSDPQFVDQERPVFTSTKTYDPGFSCAFRQQAAESHCRLIHGYALAVRIEFSTQDPDKRGWVIDFGGLASLKEDLCYWFDHKLCVDVNDPQRQSFLDLESAGLAEVRVFNRGVGCERFAEHIAILAQDYLYRVSENHRVWVSKVEVREHGGNSAVYVPPVILQSMSRSRVIDSDPS